MREKTKHQGRYLRNGIYYCRPSKNKNRDSRFSNQGIICQGDLVRKIKADILQRKVKFW